jgi:hypothetical protein
MVGTAMPLSLTDDQLDLLTDMAGPVPPLLRSVFLEEVAARLTGCSASAPHLRSDWSDGPPALGQR